MSRTGSTRSSRSPTAAPCCATDASRPFRRGDFDVAEMVQAMTGRADVPDRGGHRRARRCAAGRATDRPDAIRLRAHEVVGPRRLARQRRKLGVRRLFGVGPETADIRRDGKPRHDRQSARGNRAGIGLVPGERRLGLVMKKSVRDNILLPGLTAGAQRAARQRQGRPLRRAS